MFVKLRILRKGILINEVNYAIYNLVWKCNRVVEESSLTFFLHSWRVQVSFFKCDLFAAKFSRVLLSLHGSFWVFSIACKNFQPKKKGIRIKSLSFDYESYIEMSIWILLYLQQGTILPLKCLFSFFIMVQLQGKIWNTLLLIVLNLDHVYFQGGRKKQDYKHRYSAFCYQWKQRSACNIQKRDYR